MCCCVFLRSVVIRSGFPSRAIEEETHLLLIESPYRTILRPILAYIDAVHQRHPEDILTVILPEFVVAHWWEYLLHNQVALRLKAALLFRSGVAVLNLPQHLRGRVPQRTKDRWKK